MIDLVITHLTHPWGPSWTLETFCDPWRPLATCLKVTNFPQNEKENMGLISLRDFIMDEAF